MTRVLGTDSASIQIAARCLRDGGLVDTEARIKLDAGPVSIRTMPR